MIDPKPIFEGINGILWGAGGMLTIMGLLAKFNLPLRKWWDNKFIKPETAQNKRLDDLEKKFDGLQKDIKSLSDRSNALLHNDIYKECVKHIANRFICSEDLANLTFVYEAYTEGGGNGLCKKMFTRVLDLTIGESPDCNIERIRVEIDEDRK